MKLRIGLMLALVMSAMVLMAGQPEITNYVGTHYKDLQDDLHRGDGVTLTALLSLLHTPAVEKDETIKRLRFLSEAYPAPSEFADRVPDFAHKDQSPPLSAAAPAVPAVPAMSESDLVKFFGSMKYKTHIHLSLLNGDEIEGIFSSFDQPRERIWVKVVNSKGEFERKVYALQKIKNVTQNPQ